jgi:hypothetical protein
MRELLQTQAEMLKNQAKTIKTMTEKFEQLMNSHQGQKQEVAIDNNGTGDLDIINNTSNSTRMLKMEENNLQIMAMMNSMQYPSKDKPKQQPKRNQEQKSTDNSVGEPTSKKANQNGTPMKTV